MDIAPGSNYMAPQTRNELQQLFAHHGIADSYIDYGGARVEIPLADRLAILALKGIHVAATGSEEGNAWPEVDPGKVQAANLKNYSEEWASLLPPVCIVTVSRSEGEQTRRVELPLKCRQAHANVPFSWKLTTEQGDRYQGSFSPDCLPVVRQVCINGEQFCEYLLTLPDVPLNGLPYGYHQFELTRLNFSAAAESEGSMPVCALSLIAAPPQCHEPDWSAAGNRLWGYSVQLYSVRSAHNWGIGDLGDVCDLLRAAAEQGADYLILNPLHAMHAARPASCSPYSPSDRRRLNPVYLNIESEPDFLASRQAWPADSFAEITTKARQLAQTESVDYVAVTELKYQVFAVMYQCFKSVCGTASDRRWQAFQRYLHAAGESLQQFASWQVNEPVEAAGACAGDAEFYCYLQWLTDLQLDSCQQLAVTLGMRVGLIRDMAVGSDMAGAEVVMNPAGFCINASVGAPPDPLAPQGQNWGLPPLDPQQMTRQAYTHFIELLRTNMTHCGALRVDHVMALMRLWWCPADDQQGRGAYVNYPVGDLFALLCLESHRNRCLVIGEDLGVVPPEIRQYLNRCRVFSNILFYFEKSDGYQFRRPEHYPQRALLMVANHDVPTLAGWWNGSDLHLRRKLGLIADESALQEQLAGRAGEREQVCHWLEAQWLLPANRFGDGVHQKFDQELCVAIIRCSARSRSQLLSVQLDDLALLELPVNIPGTSSEYPNWRRKLPESIWQQLGAGIREPVAAGILAERYNAR